MRSTLLSVFLFATPISSLLIAQSRVTADITSLYAKAKSDYLKFENIHGGYIQTDNVLMHYLSWGNPENTPLI